MTVSTELDLIRSSLNGLQAQLTAVSTEQTKIVGMVGEIKGRLDTQAALPEQATVAYVEGVDARVKVIEGRVWSSMLGALSGLAMGFVSLMALVGSMISKKLGWT